jgi:Predicted membrane protein (DUF2079)
LFLLGIVALRLLVVPVPELEPRRVVAVGVELYASIFSFVTVTRHFTFRTHALDIGYYVQLTWNRARGHGLYVSLPKTNAWGDHLSPIVYLFVPAFWLMLSAAVLLVGQSVLLTLGALPVFGIERHRFRDERPAAALAILYLLNPSVHGLNVRGFHAASARHPIHCCWRRSTSPRSERPWLFVLGTVLTLMCRRRGAPGHRARRRACPEPAPLARRGGPSSSVSSLANELAVARWWPSA